MADDQIADHHSADEIAALRAENEALKAEVDHGGQHAHVVTGSSIETRLADFDTTDNISSPDDNGDLNTQLVNFHDLASDIRHHGGIHPEGLEAHESFSTEFNEDSLIARLFDIDRFR